MSLKVSEFKRAEVASVARSDENTYLRGARVLEVADELGEYAGKLLAGMGADVVKVEPPDGENTRSYGPFYQDQFNINRSLYFWHYNIGKRGVALDLDSEAGQVEFASLAAHADVIIDSRPHGYLSSRGLGYADLSARNPELIYLRITPFGDEGPWANYQGSDLVHLALGGVMMNCGYDPEPGGFYETPPIAPQMWQAYQIAGELAAMTVLAALHYRLRTGKGQYLSSSVHQANASATELDIPNWVVLRKPHRRQTGRHSTPDPTAKALSLTKDGRYLLPYATYIRNFPSSWDVDIATLRKYAMQEDLDDPRWADPEYRKEHQEHISALMNKLVNGFTYSHEFWREMVDAGLPWAPVRKPEENLHDQHWLARNSFHDVEHPELGKAFTYVGARWVSNQVDWSRGPRAPMLGEHNDVVTKEWASEKLAHVLVRSRLTAVSPPVLSKRGKPFALSGIRAIDLGWMLASAGSGRFLASMGAEVIKVEHISHLDGMRFTPVVYPKGGRSERDRATTAIPVPEQETVNQSGNFMEVNAGKLALSLNLKEQRGKEILEDLIRDADFLIEGYSPGTMDRMGLGYERLKELNPRIIYVQQSGLGQQGTYGRAKAFGPTAQAFSGLTEMSGFPTPWPPAGIGFSYLDWFGAYNMATAMLAALYRRDITGQGCHIDASQVEVGLYLSGTAILDYTANGRVWTRYGNRSPYKPAAPHGAYRAQGDDRWVAIANFTQEQWLETIKVLGHPDWASDPKFATLESRIENQDELDTALNAATIGWDRWELMDALQANGVPAGVVQDAQDRVDYDPQLKALGWQVELDQTENGTWPVKEHPVRLSETPTYVGGLRGRHGPNYGEDNDDVLSRILGYTADEIEVLRKEKIV
jgi:crotonobetainyl-CoA:carnitine CoA-transferase CaiB-like acyl-CoA transferase